MSKFPIERIVVERGRPYKKILNKGDTVNCYFCGSPIVLDDECIRYDNGVELIHCDNRECGRTVDAFYYFDKFKPALEKPLKRKRNVRKVRTYTSVG